jgi:hypothetical protein
LSLRNADLTIEIAVLPISETLTQRAVARAVAGRQEAYADELQRIVEATYRVIEKTGTVDPTLRDILRESKLLDPGVLSLLHLEGRAPAGPA